MHPSAPATDFSPFVRPVRAAFVGLGRIYDLNMRAYVDNDDVEVVAIVDPSEVRRAQRQLDWPDARAFASIGDLAASDVAVDCVEVLVPIILHEEVASQCLSHGWHVNLQKPMANDLASAERMVAAARASGRQLRVMENYLFYEPLGKLKQVVDSGELGPISGYHLKMVASGRGGWDVPSDTYERQFEQAGRGRGGPHLR
jgi:predicted dehydrogenase